MEAEKWSDISVTPYNSFDLVNKQAHHIAQVKDMGQGINTGAVFIGWCSLQCNPIYEFHNQ